ncbi:MAG: methyl-accepting chemotaxis protein [Erythrobacter sp.]
MPDTQFSQRLEFYGLHRPDPDTFRGVSSALERRIDIALDAFYETISGNPELAAFFDNRQQMNRAKNKQGEHWRAVFRDGVDERFQDRAVKIGNVHARIGLEPHWYIGAYSLVLEHLVMEIIAPGWQRYLPWKRAQARQVTALLKVSLLDIDLALTGYFTDMKEQTRSIVSGRLGTALEQMASGDLTVSVSGFPEEYRKVEEDFNAATASLNTTITSVVSGVHAMTTGSSEIRVASDDLARRTEEQAANLEETAAAVAQTTARVQETAETAGKARRTIQSATTMADDGARIVAEAVTAMDQIEKSSSEITNIISVIDSIAFQTNLLALNAGVEAARAGETGKGFAVVASEVRALAQRCAEAADEVKALITVSSQHVSSGVDLVSRSGEAFAAITKGVAELSQAVETIADSTGVQADSLAQINAVVGDLDRSTQQNAAMAEECTAAAASLAREAEKLGETFAAFRTDASAQTGQLQIYSRQLAA